MPLFDGEHVTEDTGTGFVHTAPSHGRDDFDIWMAHGRELAARGIDTRIPYTVDADGFLTEEAPGFTGKRVLDDKGNKGDANEAVIKALIDAGKLVARGRLKHQYPHSWRSKKPLIFRNTPQWFIALDKHFEVPTLSQRRGGRRRRRVRGYDRMRERNPSPAAPRRPSPTPRGRDQQRRTDPARNRARRNRPHELVSVAGREPHHQHGREPAGLGRLAPARLGLPIAIFVRKGTSDILVDAKVNARIATAFAQEGADAWFAADAAARFLAPDYKPEDFDKIDDVLDVWFDSGSTHAFTLEDAKDFPGLSGITRKRDGGDDASCISKAPTSIAAGFNPRCSRAAARAAGRRSISC